MHFDDFFPFMSNSSVWVSKATMRKWHWIFPEGAEGSKEEAAQGMLGEGHQSIRKLKMCGILIYVKYSMKKASPPTQCKLQSFIPSFSKH